MAAGDEGTTFSANSIGKVILVVIVALLFALPADVVIYTLIYHLFEWLGADPDTWLVNVLAGLCAIGLVGFLAWIWITSIMRPSPKVPVQQVTQPTQIRRLSRYTLSAFLIGVIWYWLNFIALITASKDLEASALLWMAMVVLFSEMALGIYRPGLRIFGATGFGVLSGWLTEVMFTLTFPNISPVNHQFLPIEPFILAFVVMLSTVLGGFAGRKLLRFLNVGAEANQINNLMFWLLTIAVILALLSPIAVLQI
jgi:hypothetical protein